MLSKCHLNFIRKYVFYCQVQAHSGFQTTVCIPLVVLPLVVHKEISCLYSYLLGIISVCGFIIKLECQLCGYSLYSVVLDDNRIRK